MFKNISAGSSQARLAKPREPGLARLDPHLILRACEPEFLFTTKNFGQKPRFFLKKYFFLDEKNIFFELFCDPNLLTAGIPFKCPKRAQNGDNSEKKLPTKMEKSHLK